MPTTHRKAHTDTAKNMTKRDYSFYNYEGIRIVATMDDITICSDTENANETIVNFLFKCGTDNSTPTELCVQNENKMKCAT